MAELETRVDRADGHVVLSVSGEVDLATAAQLRDAGLRALGVEPTTMVLDLSRVSFMDSTGLSVLVLLRRKARSHRSTLRLISSRKVDAILRIAGLDQVFELHADLGSALDEGDASA